MAGRHRKPPPKRGQGRHRRPDTHGHWALPALVAVMVLGAGGVGAHAALSGGSATPQPPASAASVPPALAPQPTATGAAASAPATASRAASPSSGRSSRAPGGGSTRSSQPLLAVTAIGAVSWIQVTGPHGQVLFSGLLRHAHRLVYRHGPLGVVIGDAGAVALSRRGHLVRPAGRPRQVLRFVVR